MSVDGQIHQTTYYGTSSGGGGRYVEEIFDASSFQDSVGSDDTTYMPTSPTKDSGKMKKSNKKNIWVPGKPMTPKAREMLESGKGAMNADGRWTCLECNRSLSNEWTLEQHIQTVHGARTFSCDKCNERFKRRDHLLNHEKTIHKGLKPCKRCNVTFNNREELRQHKLKVHYKPLPDGTMPPIPRYLTQPIEDDPSAISPPIRSPPLTQTQSHSYQIVAPVPQVPLQEVSQPAGQNLLTNNTPITATQQIVIQALPTNRSSEISQSFSQTITIPQIVQPNLNAVTPVAQNSVSTLTPVSRKELKMLKGKKWRRSFGNEEDLYNDSLLDDDKTHCDVFGCDKQFNNNDDFHNHWQKMHEENRCQLCKQLFSGSRSMKVHGSVHEPSKPNSNVADENRIIPEGFKCWFCPGVFREKDTLLDHVDAFHVGCVCLECGSCLLGSEQCGDHIADQHPPQKVLEEDQDRCHYQCSACFHIFTKRIEAERHFVEQHFVAENKKVFHCCPYCPDVFQSYVRLNDHIQWEHGLDEIDENAIVMKNCESQQFFQCEICDHFFQTESILEKHIEGHQVQKVARYQVLPQHRTSPSKRKRKHSKKHKKKSEKIAKELHSREGRHRQENNNTPANTKESLDVDSIVNIETDDLLKESETSDMSHQSHTLENKRAKLESKCQDSKVLVSTSFGQEPDLTIANTQEIQPPISMSSSAPNILDNAIVEEAANPEIETAVASICGTTLGKLEESPQRLVSEGMDTDPSILPLTGGTLEIENAVNSILGESAISNDTDESNNLLFDIKHNTESFSHTNMTGPEHQVVKHNESPLEKDIANGIVRINDSNGMSEAQHLSDLLGSTISKNSQTGIINETEDTTNGNDLNHSSIFTNNLAQVHNVHKSNEEYFLPGSKSTFPIKNAQGNFSGQNGINEESHQTEKMNNFFPNNSEQSVQEYTESPQIKDSLTATPSESSKPSSYLDTQDLQANATIEKIGKTTISTFDSDMLMSVTQQIDFKPQNTTSINNGDALNHH